MLILNKKYYSKMCGYYKNAMSKLDYMCAILSFPRKRKINIEVPENTNTKKKIKEDIVPANNNITILLKPIDAMYKREKKIFDYLDESGYEIEDKFLVKDFSMLIDELYYNGNKVARSVVELFKSDPKLNKRCGVVICIRRNLPTDLINLKKTIRKLTGFDFFVIKNVKDEIFVGLNSIHIPDYERMKIETEIMKKYRYE